MNAAPSEDRRITMADVAHAAGFHKSTVSLALRNQSGVPLATREHICQVAKQLGYRRDPVLDAFNFRRRALQAPKALRALAFVCDLPDRVAFNASERHREIFSAARAQAEQLDFALELFLVSPTGLSPTRLNQILQARGIVGVLLGACASAGDELALDWPLFSAIGIESQDLRPRLDNLSTNYREAARLSVRQLRRAGCKRIGFTVAASLGAEIEAQLRAGYLVEYRSAARAKLLAFHSARQEDAESIRAWIAAEKPEAVVCCGLDPGPWCSADFPAPDGRFWASIDITHALPSIPGVPPLHRELGRRAVELLAMRLQANLRGAPSHLSTTLLSVAWRE
jgi:DNA-binding LacI/PurR family transcriptional regulator